MIFFRPKDSRMWVAIAGCYEKMDRKDEATKCLEKGELSKDKEGIALHKLAKLYVSIGEYDKAASCFRENLTRKEQEDFDTQETTDALLYLAKYSKLLGKYEEAINYAQRLHDFSGTERDLAVALLREINNLA